jgi:hypothetical protein
MGMGLDKSALSNEVPPLKQKLQETEIMGYCKPLTIRIQNSAPIKISEEEL